MQPIRIQILFLVLATSNSLFSQSKTISTDVLVIGGSTGGTAAGIQCARMGVKTIIVEQTTWLGGMLTAAGVSCTDGNDELHSGIWMEFREALYKHYGTRNLATGWVSETCFEPHVGDSIFKAWAREAEIDVYYEWYFDKAVKNGNKVIAAVFKNKKGEMFTVNAKLVIDGTDLGDVFANAGAAFDIGMEDPNYSKEKMAPGKFSFIQDLTLAATLKDYGKGQDKTIARPANYDSTLYFCCCTDAKCINGKPYNVDAQKMLDYGRIRGDKFMLNWPAHGNDYYINVTSIKPIDRDEALKPARERTLGFIYFIQKELGFKNIGIADDEFPSADGLALIPYHREGRRLKGVVRLNVNHLTKPFDQAEKLYRTGIAVGDYPVDHHHAPEKKVPAINFPRVPSFNVPLGALIPEKIDGLIVCEKGISVTNIVNGSTRLQPCVLLTGEAAGIMAALSIQQNKQPRKIDIRSVQKELLNRKAYIMPYVDVKPVDSFWLEIQRVGATGILRGTGKPEGWANKTFFYPDSTITEKELAKGLFEFENNFPVKKYQGEKPLNVDKAWNMIVEMQHHLRIKKGIPHPWPPIIAFEYKSAAKEFLHKPIDGKKVITRRELAVLIDHLAQSPFDEKVDWRGRIIVTVITDN